VTWTPFRQWVSIENPRIAGVQQAHREDRIGFTALTPLPGDLISAAGRYVEAESGVEKRAAIFIGPEFGTVTRPDLADAAREPAEANFNVLIAQVISFRLTAPRVGGICLWAESFACGGSVPP